MARREFLNPALVLLAGMRSIGSYGGGIGLGGRGRWGGGGGRGVLRWESFKVLRWEGGSLKLGIEQEVAEGAERSDG